MSAVDIFTSRCANWAQGLEIISDSGSKDTYTEKITVEKGSAGLVGAVLDPDSLLPPTAPTDVTLTVKDPDNQVVLNSEENSDNSYVHFHEGKLNAFAVPNPKNGVWELKIGSPQGHSYALNLSAFKARPSVAELQAWQSQAARTPGGPPTLRCRACKLVTKGLGAAIIAAAIHLAFPPALIAVVAAHLGGVATEVAQAFLSTLLGFSRDEIAEKLCKAIRLC